MKDMFERGSISEAEYKTLVSAETQNKEIIEKAIKAPAAIKVTKTYLDEDIISGDAENLTEEDKIALARK